MPNKSITVYYVNGQAHVVKKNQPSVDHSEDKFNRMARENKYSRICL